MTPGPRRSWVARGIVQMELIAYGGDDTSPPEDVEGTMRSLLLAGIGTGELGRMDAFPGQGLVVQEFKELRDAE